MFARPEELITHISLMPGTKVGDFGAGSGAYTFALREKVGDEGAIYAFDLNESHIESLCCSCARHAFENVFPMCADLEELIPLKNDVLTAGIVINTLYNIRNKKSFLSELHRVLRPGSPVLLVDWMSSFNHMGPHPDSVVSPGEARRLLASHGFSVGTSVPAGTHHYAFVARAL